MKQGGLENAPLHLSPFLQQWLPHDNRINLFLDKNHKSKNTETRFKIFSVCTFFQTVIEK